MTMTFNKEQALEIHNFISENLQVVNDLPYIEGLMLDLEEHFNLNED